MGLMPLATACLVAAGIVMVLAFAVLPTDADPGPSVSGPIGNAVIASDSVSELSTEPTVTPTPTRRPGRDIIIEVLPTPTVRVIRRPQPTAEPTDEPAEPPEPTEPAEPVEVADSVEPTIARRLDAPASEELVENGGFEEREFGWYLEQGAGVTTGDAHGGEGFLLVEATGGYADQRVPVEPGVTYQVSVWARVSGTPADAVIGVRYEDGRYNAVAGDPVQIAVASGGWTNITFTIVPPAGATQALITFWNPHGSEQLLVDDVSIHAVH